MNALTVDVEDYFHVEAFSKEVSRRYWDHYPLRVVTSTRRLLDLLDRCNVRATFFVLGWIAHRRPSLVREIAERGHELGCHSYWHRLVYNLERHEFRGDTADATRAVEDAAGAPVRLYRAPSYSVTERSVWALEVLAEMGFEIDSSIFPIRHDIYGFPSFPRFPVDVRLGPNSSIVEFPMSTVRHLGANFPGAGGGYLRILPLGYSIHALRRINRHDRRPGVVYLHPWEVDADQPRLDGPARSRFRHYTGLGKLEAKLGRLVRKFAFAPMGEVIRRHPPEGEYRPGVPQRA